MNSKLSDLSNRKGKAIDGDKIHKNVLIFLTYEKLNVWLTNFVRQFLS